MVRVLLQAGRRRLLWGQEGEGRERKTKSETFDLFAGGVLCWEREGGGRSSVLILIFFMSDSQALGLREGEVRGMLGVILERVLPATSAFPSTPALERPDWLCWCPEMSMSMSMSMPACVGSPGQLSVVCSLWANGVVASLHGLRVECVVPSVGVAVTVSWSTGWMFVM